MLQKLKKYEITQFIPRTKYELTFIKKYYFSTWRPRFGS